MNQKQDTFQILKEAENGFLNYEIGVKQKSIIGNSRAYQADCMDMLRQTPDKYYSLAICDPPYGIGAAKERPHNGWKDWGIKNWDNSVPSEFYFKELFRVSKNQIVWGANHFIDLMPYRSSCWVIWDKGQRNFSLADAELAWTSFDKAVRIYELHRSKNIQDKIHPTQKPRSLYRWLLTNYAKQGDKILDTHLGSGSSRIAAYQLGFDFTGYEIDKDYFIAQEKRFKLVTSQTQITFKAS